MRFLDSAMLRIASLGMTSLDCGVKYEIAALGCASLAMTLLDCGASLRSE